MDTTVSHLCQNGGKVDWQARIADVDAKVHQLHKRLALLEMEGK